MRADCGLNVCIFHPASLADTNANSAAPEIHGGKDETSVMLALAPELVRRERVGKLQGKPSAKPDAKAVRALVLDPAVSWPWSSGDPRIADRGVMGDAGAASAQHGKAIIERVVEAAGGVFKQLRDNRKR